MRRVIVKIKNGPKQSDYRFEEGVFHQWGLESRIHDAGIENFTVAIVELTDGRIITVLPKDIENFTEKNLVFSTFG